MLRPRASHCTCPRRNSDDTDTALWRSYPGARSTRAPIGDISFIDGINDREEIAAQANPVVNGVVNLSVAHAILLVPSTPDDPIAYGGTRMFAMPNGNQAQTPKQVNIGHFVLKIRPQ